MDSIQTISAVTEEVSAHASETYDACEENAAMVSNVTELVNLMNAEAETLRTQTNA